MRRAAALVPLLLLSLAPAVAAAPESACGGSDHYAETLQVALPASPETVRAGRPTSVPVTVTRAGAPVAGASVFIALQYGAAPEDVVVAGTTTGADGRAVLTATVPRQARSALLLEVDATTELFAVPCYGTIGEHGAASSGWGRAVR